jgi:hypothetical protein
MLFVQRELTIVNDTGSQSLVVELSRPERTASGACASSARIHWAGKIFEKTILGEDSLQSLKLSLLASGRKVRAIAASEGADVRWLESEASLLLEDQRELERLEASLTNAIEALQVARDLLAEPNQSPEARSKLVRRLAGVIESAGVVDLDGRHLRTKMPTDWAGGWSERPANRD